MNQLKCTNQNHQCTGFENGNCKMSKSTCVFQLKVKK